MSTERIAQLHQTASERYLNGDYEGAIEAWHDVLAIDASDEEAQGGIRMASQLVDAVSPTSMASVATVAPAAHEVEHELDRGLQILDGLGGPGGMHVGAEGATDSKPASEVPVAPKMEGFVEGWENPGDQSGAGGSFGLEPVRPASAVPTPASAAAAELRRRVEDLLGQAKNKAQAGERDEALAILARLAILDDENAEADSLRAKLEAAGASDHDEIERTIIEGVAEFEADRLDEAEQLFRDVLARAPQHREAKDYLSKIADKRSGAHEELLHVQNDPPVPMHDVQAPDEAPVAVSLLKTPPPAPPKKAPRAAAAQPEPPVAPPAARRFGFALPPQKALIVGGVAAVLLALAAIALPKMSGKSKTAAAAPPMAHTQKPRGAKPGTAGGIGTQARSATMGAAVPGTPEERAKALSADLAKGQSLLAAGSFADSVVAFNDALTIDPGNAEAKAGLTAAGDHYKASKAERDAIENIKLAFRDGEFTSGLRLAYRLPPTVAKSYTDGIKVAGWYNLAIVAMRAGDCREAEAHLDEALAIAPADQAVKKLKDLAAQYADAVKDRGFLNRVEGLAFRPMPES